MARKLKAKAAKVASIVNLKVLEDNDLIERFKAGCQFSYEEIISRYEAKAHNLAMRLTRNSEDAEEVLQDVFLTVYRKIDGFEGKAKFSSWLYRITVNAAFMKLRKRKQDHSISLDEMTPYMQNKTLAQRSLFGTNADTKTFTLEIRGALEQAIAKLPDDYRAVFVLRDIDGLSNKEVSEILTLSIPAIKSRLHRSRLMLRRKLSKFYEDYASEDTILTGENRLLRYAA